MLNVVTRRIQKNYNQGGDLGAAIVAAIGVMIICISLGALIISQAISTQRDSGRNRARTVQIHSAEAAVDQIYQSLQHGSFECEFEFNDQLGPDGVVVKGKLEYWNADGTIHDCSEGLPLE